MSPASPYVRRCPCVCPGPGSGAPTAHRRANADGAVRSGKSSSGSLSRGLAPLAARSALLECPITSQHLQTHLHAVRHARHVAAAALCRVVPVVFPCLALVLRFRGHVACGGLGVSWILSLQRPCSWRWASFVGAAERRREERGKRLTGCVVTGSAVGWVTTGCVVGISAVVMIMSQLR